MRTIEASAMDLPIQGRNLSEKTLGKEIGDRPVLMVFLRHFG